MNVFQKEETKNVKESLLNLQKIITSTKLLDSLLTKCLLIEYKYLQKFCPSGIYILPQFDDIKVWHGVIFIREGYYREGIFKFEILIPQNYPSKPPEIQFSTKIFHPLIDLSSGKLDISVKFYIKKKKFLSWEIGKNFIVQILYFIQNLFYEISYFQDTNSFNPSAATLFNDNPKKFEEEIAKYCKKSFEERYENRNNNCSIKFSKHNAKYHQIILDKILKQNKDVETYDRIEDFKNWFMNNFMEIIQSENNSLNNQ